MVVVLDCEQFLGFQSDYQFFVGGNFQYNYGGVWSVDQFDFVGEFGVGFFIQFDVQGVQVGVDLGVYDRHLFAYVVGEDQHVQAVYGCEVGVDVFFDLVVIDFQCCDGLGILVQQYFVFDFVYVV